MAASEERLTLILESINDRLRAIDEKLDDKADHEDVQELVKRVNLLETFANRVRGGGAVLVAAWTALIGYISARGSN